MWGVTTITRVGAFVSGFLLFSLVALLTAVVVGSLRVWSHHQFGLVTVGALGL